MNYVLGFAIWRGSVLLMKKTGGPEMIIGKLNGVGGKMEANEDVFSAMSREFMEETATETWPSAWMHRAHLSSDDWDMDVLVNFLPDVTDFSDIKNPEHKGETLEWVPLSELNTKNIVPNLSWIIPMVLDLSTGFAFVRV